MNGARPAILGWLPPTSFRPNWTETFDCFRPALQEVDGCLFHQLSQPLWRSSKYSATGIVDPWKPASGQRNESKTPYVNDKRLILPHGNRIGPVDQEDSGRRRPDPRSG
jgi:hypothetical protein